MSENSKENENSKKNDASDPKSDQQSDKVPEAKKKSAKAAKGADIDNLLSDVESSLSDVSEQLGESKEDDVSEENAAVDQKNSNLSGTEEKISKVDNTLEELQNDLGDLVNQINESSEKTEDKQLSIETAVETEDGRETQSSQTSQAKDTNSPDAQSEENVDDMLAELADELEGLNESEQQVDPATGDSDEHATQTEDTDAKAIQDRQELATEATEATDADKEMAEKEMEEVLEHSIQEQEPPADQIKDEPPGEDVDDLLAQLDHVMTQEDEDKDSTEPVSKEETPKEPSPESKPAVADDEITTEQQQPEDEVTGKQSNDNVDDIIADLSDIMGKDDQEPAQEQLEPPTEKKEALEATAAAEKDDEPAPSETSDKHDGEGESKEEQQQKPQGNVEEKEENKTADDTPYKNFKLPQRMLVQGLDKVNKPFEKVPTNMKDTLGLIGVITMIVSVLTMALIMIFT